MDCRNNPNKYFLIGNCSDIEIMFTELLIATRQGHQSFDLFQLQRLTPACHRKIKHSKRSLLRLSAESETCIL